MEEAAEQHRHGYERSVSRVAVVNLPECADALLLYKSPRQANRKTKSSPIPQCWEWWAARATGGKQHDYKDHGHHTDCRRLRSSAPPSRRSDDHVEAFPCGERQ